MGLILQNLFLSANGFVTSRCIASTNRYTTAVQASPSGARGALRIGVDGLVNTAALATGYHRRATSHCRALPVKLT